MDKLSFVIINRNNQESLNKCLQAIKKIKYANKETILVDDYSTDKSIQRLRSKVDILIKNKKQKGIAFSRNIGIQKSKGRYLFIIDSDIEILNIDPKKIIGFFRKNKKLIGVSGNYHTPDNLGWNSVLDLRRKSLFSKNKHTFFYGLGNDYTTFSGGFCCISKNRLNSVSQEGELNASGEDLFFQILMLNWKWQFGYIKELEGEHFHKRNLFNAFKKAKSEARGDIWLMFKVLDNNSELPIFDPIYSVPLLLVMGLIFASPILVIIEFLPHLILMGKQRNLLSVKLFLYEMTLSILKLGYALKEMLLTRHSIKTKLKFTKHIVRSTFIGKYFSVIRVIKYES